MKRDIYTQVTDQIIAELERGVLPWRKPWSAGHPAGPVSRPLRHNSQPYSGKLIVDNHNKAIAEMSGTATGSCGTIGQDMGGGKLASCESGYALIAQPSGCESDPNNPTCGGTDYNEYQWSTEDHDTKAYSYNDGQNISSGNTYKLMGRAASVADTYPAAEYCANLVLNGHSDWYLPARDELVNFENNKSAIGGFMEDGYWSSSDQKFYIYNARTVLFSDSANAPGNKSFTYPVRCARRCTSC